MVTAVWKRGFEGFHKANAQKVAEEILSIGDSATPQQIVERAMDEGSELHRCFTWDDDEAAKKWRLQEARMIVCHLVIENTSDDENAPEVRFFHRIDSGGYKQADRIFRRADEYAELLKCALADLHAFKLKYETLQELDYILTLID